MPTRFLRRKQKNLTEFNLAYIHENPHTHQPTVLVLPGGPGLASILPYKHFRSLLVKAGLNVLMIEHRGLGQSRKDVSGRDLPPSALSIQAVIDDIVAVLEQERLDKVIVYGSSYGGYLAQVLGVLHPERVNGMILDSAWSAPSDDMEARENLRSMFWYGRSPWHALACELLHRAVERNAVPVSTTGTVIPVVYEMGGSPLVEDVLGATLNGQVGVWNWLASTVASEVSKTRRNVMESDLVGEILFRELYKMRPDGHPLDTALAFEGLRSRYSPFVGPPVDVPRGRTSFSWPVLVLSGERDTRSIPSQAQRMADSVPDGTLLPIPNFGHSVLDGHPLGAVRCIQSLQQDTHRTFPALLHEIQHLPLASRTVVPPKLLSAALTISRWWPGTQRVPEA